jgi:signal peptidase I
MKQKKETKDGLSEYERILKQGMAVHLKTSGWSMYPLIAEGRDEVIIEPVGKHRLRRGDVVLYRRPGSILVLHRIHHVTKDGLYLVGDNQKEIEGPLAPRQVKGILRVIIRIRTGKEISVHHPLYLLYSHVWLALRPLRPVISRTVAKIKRFFQSRGR